eukprot:TRINITY_DN362_c3_g6_i2.p1 TRINITY_DN362_c3_g6~~TRINITY_DN362_c3_g6_i2.p1  ORF type:complete len:356 (+),score=99.20 TRINITY_DN362_c3_g6_i2:2078-3145(+)
MGKKVKWQWQGDDKEWVDYVQRVADKLEEARESKTKVRVDSQRFVDLKALLQCRYDQSGRKRPVRRVEEGDSDDEEAEKIFEGSIFFLLGDTFSCSREKLVSAIDEGGGLVAWGFHKRVTHVITDKKQIEGGGFSHIQKESAKHGIPILSDQFVLSSKSKKTLLPTSSFLLVSSQTKQSNKDSDNENKTNGVKRKNSKGNKDDDDDDKMDTSDTEEQKTKKPPLKKQKSNADDDDTAALYDALDAQLQKGNEMKGKMVVREHVFDMAVVNRKGDELNGTCEWPTLDNTITKWKGSVVNNHELEINEFEAMEGDGVELPNKYKGRAIKKNGGVVIVGIVKDPHGEESPFEISLPSH